MFLQLLLVALVGALSLGFAYYSLSKINAFSVSNERVNELSGIIQSGAMTFLFREYRWLAPFVVVVALFLAFKISIPTAVSFVFGALCSGVAGFIGMKVATRANGKTAFAATEGMNASLRIAFIGGTVMGMSVVGIGVVGVVICYFLFGDPNVITGFGFGASSIALFARVGGGIYTKAADVGADLVGKVEAGIPEDDPRNPAVIADNVGDNVGDIAGMGADLFESYVNSIIAAMAIGLVVAGDRGIIYPLFLAAIGIIAAILGTFFVRVKEGGNPQLALRMGTISTGFFMIIGTWFLTSTIFEGDLTLFYAVMAGVLAGVLVGYVTEIYTSAAYKSVKDIAKSSETGPATNILAGIGVGMKSTAIPVLIICAAILVGVKFGGLYGIACAAVGMLSITGMTLSVDAYGPIADNAGRWAISAKVRKITDKLDAVGNTTAAIGKGLAIGSAALTALALFSAYGTAVGLESIDLKDPKVMVGLFIGGMLPFLFSALTIQAVGRAAQAMIEEVRRQFKEIPGIMEGTGRPEYERCVDISTAASLKEMIIPGILAVVTPLAVGLLLGAEALGGLLGGSIVTGVMMAIFMSNAGGAWDNAKKYIEEGHHGGKGSEPHAAAVTGDTVGDPFKDTSGPSLNILIKLMSVVALVLAPLFL
ncbi:MAG TPA: sodium-translocating pyrophosphatase [Synergistaceae bacterium]|nr:sodium-translocating pyrophosphatase [Synergistaceae bacterium]